MENMNMLLLKNLEDLTSFEERKIVDKLCQRFLIEHQKNDKGGIYSISQIVFAYNSNRMEGSTLSEDQTKNLFLTGTLPQSDDIYVVKDVEEATGHFLMFNETLHNYLMPLSQDMIKKFHYCFKQAFLKTWLTAILVVNIKIVKTLYQT